MCLFLDRAAWYCYEHVCLSVSLYAEFWNHMSELRQIIRVCYLWPCFCGPLSALRYRILICTSGFCGRRDIARNGHEYAAWKRRVLNVIRKVAARIWHHTVTWRAMPARNRGGVSTVAVFRNVNCSWGAIGNESLPIQLAQCWFPRLVISNDKI